MSPYHLGIHASWVSHFAAHSLVFIRGGHETIMIPQHTQNGLVIRTDDIWL